MKYFFIFFSLGVSLFAKVPDFSLVAFEKESWKIVVCQDKESCKVIQTEQEPRTYDYDFNSGNLVYVASDKTVRLVIEGKEKQIIGSEKDAYTEPSFIRNGTEIMLVCLIDGNSKQTKIVSVDFNGTKLQTLVSQHATSLEPFSSNGTDVYYANVSCVEGCGKIIQEIWHKDTITSEAKQLTLLNVLSHQPQIDPDNNIVYFSSVKGGNYHVWSYTIGSKQLKQLTFGDVTDSFPSPYSGGILFLRRVGARTALMNFEEAGKIKEIKLPSTYQKIRHLKVKQ